MAPFPPFFFNEPGLAATPVPGRENEAAHYPLAYTV
jgi:hypothetical protein